MAYVVIRVLHSDYIPYDATGTVIATDETRDGALTIAEVAASEEADHAGTRYITCHGLREDIWGFLVKLDDHQFVRYQVGGWLAEYNDD